MLPKKGHKSRQSTNWTLSLLLVITICPALIFADLVLDITGFGYGLQATREVSRVSSEVHRLDAVLYESDAGATTSFAYSVGFERGGGVPTGPDTVFTADGIDGEEIEVRWEGADLVIRYPASARVYQKLSGWGPVFPSIRVRYDVEYLQERD